MDKPFDSVLGEIMYPGDPAAHPANVYNCRCTLGSKVIGFEKQDGSGNVLISEGKSGIIEAEPASKYVNSSDELFRYAQKIKPIPGYENMVIHGNTRGFELRDKDDKTVSEYTPREFAEILREDPNYHGGAVRLISCSAGADEMGAAQLLANQLQVDVMAPTDTVWVSSEGEMVFGKTKYENTGEWKVFKPQRR